MSVSEKSTFLVSKWKDPTYRGCFAGVTSFTKIVNADFKLGVTKKQVLKALMSIPSFVDRINSKTKPERRHFDITSAFDTWSMDLAFLKKIQKVYRLPRLCRYWIQKDLYQKYYLSLIHI